MKTIRQAALLGAAAAALAAQAAPPACQVRSAATAPLVVELYTSEGCSSCPPADRWLSSLKGRGDVLALAFHVNYWDRLGWVDRFATAETTARQTEAVHAAGGRQLYTPQVLVDGRDWPDWPRLPPQRAVSAVTVTLARTGDAVTAEVAALGAGPARLDGYWAVLEDGYSSRVRAGENAGATLRHDDVVRLFRPERAWAAAEGHRSTLQVGEGQPQYPRRVVFVVTDAATHRPLQAVALGC